MKTISNEKWVIDTNLLVYIQDKHSPFYPGTRELFELIKHHHITAIVTQQTILEAEKALIRVYKITPEKSVEFIEDLIIYFDMMVIHPQVNTYILCNTMLKNRKGIVDIFDLYLAATMIDNGYFNILTNNTKDFEGIEDLTVVNPFR